MSLFRYFKMDDLDFTPRDGDHAKRSPIQASRGALYASRALILPSQNPVQGVVSPIFALQSPVCGYRAVNCDTTSCELRPARRKVRLAKPEMACEGPGIPVWAGEECVHRVCHR